MKTRILKILLLNLLMISSLAVYTQNNIDSLRKVLLVQREDTSKVNTLNWLSGSYCLKDDYENAMDYAKQALSLSEKINFKKGRGSAYNNIGGIYMLQRNLPEALNNSSKALKIMQEIDDKAGISACYDIIRCAYTLHEKIPEAIKYSYLKFKIDEEIGDKRGMGESLYSIGYLYSSLNNDSEALKNYRASFKIHEQIGDKELIAVSASRLADVYFKQGNYSEALKYDSIALKIYEKIGRGELSGLTSIHLNIGKVYAKLGEKANAKGDKANAADNFDKSLKNYLRALQLFSEYKDTEGIADAYINLGKLYIKLNNLSLAKSYLGKSLQLYKATKEYHTESLSDNYNALSNIDSILGNFKQAYEHYKRYILYRDSLITGENIRKSEGYKMQYEFDKKEDKIKLLSTQNKLQSALAQQQSQRKNIAYAGIGLILLAAGYGFYRFRKKKKLQNQQSLMNERLRISHELHDEVGATLSGIAMYSHLTKEQIKNANITEVQKSLNIMQQSAGEMVNKLNDIVWLINPDQDSLQKLVQRLEEYATDMAMIKNMQVKVNVPAHLAEHNLPVESRRNIYLFCKEAINNAVKYSNGTLLELNIKEIDHKLEFSVSDNGKGFDAVMVRRGNGLENMQQRADEIGAKLTLQSKSNEGCSVSMRVKIT